jgi:ankyrin repeat protein
MSALALIHKACRTGSLDTVCTILDAQPILLDTVDDELGWTPLYRAVMCGHAAIVQELLRRGSDANRLNKFGEAPLHQAVSVSEEVVVALLDSGASIDVRQLGNLHSDGETPLHLAASKGRTNLVRLLLRRRATVDLPTFLVAPRQYGKTALHFAVEGGFEDIAKLLLRAGACIDLKDKVRPMQNGLTPLESAETATMRQILLSNPMTPPKPEILAKSKYSIKPASFRVLDLEEGTQATESLFKTIDPEPVTHAAQQVTCDSDNFRFNPSNDVSGAYSTRGAKDLLSWLSTHRLEDLYRVLIDNGYDDLEMLQETQKSEVPLTKEMLRSIGVMKPGLAARLLGLLELETNTTIVLDIGETDRLNCCGRPTIATSSYAYPSLLEWLERMSLGYLHEHFVSAGYDDFEHLILLNKTTQRLTDEVLYRELGIKMIGHRHRILFRLMEDSRTTSQQSSFVSRVETEQRCAPCKSCLVS